MVEYERADRDIILVMGLTGAGKTYFINQLIGARLKEGHTLKSCTQGCQIVETNVGNTEFVIMDCPGFDDTTRSDADILKVISEQLSAVRLQGYNLKGIIYLRRITDNRMQGSEMSAINLFKKLVGEDALCNVVLATTMWGKVTDLAEANARDSELREEYWSDMKSRGATTTRFDGTTASAEGIASQLLGKKPVVLKVQEQLVDQGMPLNQTAAGAVLEPKIDLEQQVLMERLKELESQLQYERNANRRLEVKRSQKRNEANLKRRMEDKATIQSKPGVEVKKRMDKFKTGSRTVGLATLQGLAAVCSITFGIVGFALGGAF